MIAVKGNVEYTINDSEKKAYIESGYDIYDDKGKKLADGEHKSISYSKYKELEGKYKELLTKNNSTKELEELNKQITEKDTKIEDLEKQIGAKEEELKKANKQIEDLTKKLEK